MDRVQELLKRFSDAVDINELCVMADCIVEMKQLEPAFVDIMMASVPDEYNEELESHIQMTEYYKERKQITDDLSIQLINALFADDKELIKETINEMIDCGAYDRAKYILELHKKEEDEELLHKFKVNDIVRIVNNNAFMYGAVGVIFHICEDEENYPYYVQFQAVDTDTEEVFVYEDGYYNESDLRLYDIKKGECC